MVSWPDKARSAADLLLAVEPVWVIAALAFSCTTLLWGLAYSWVGLAIGAAAFPLRRWRKGYWSRRTPLGISAALFLVASSIGLSVSPDRGLSLRVIQSSLACILLYYSLVNLPHPAYLQWGLALSAVGVFVGGLLALRDGFSPPSLMGGLGVWVQSLLRHLPQVPRPPQMAPPMFSATHGLTVAVEMVLLPLAGVMVFGRRAPPRLAAVSLILPLLFLLFLVGSQAAWLAVLCGLAFLVICRAPRALLPLAVATSLGYVGYRLEWLDPRPFLSDFSPGESLSGRVELWRAAVDVIRRYPVTGCGPGCLGTFSATPLLSPHSAYLQYYADAGLLGAAALVLALVAIVRMSVDVVRAYRDHPWYGFAVGILAAGGAIAVHGLFEGSPAGIIAETPDGYLYIVSPVAAILAGLFLRTRRQMDEGSLECEGDPPRHAVRVETVL